MAEKKGGKGASKVADKKEGGDGKINPRRKGPKKINKYKQFPYPSLGDEKLRMPRREWQALKYSRKPSEHESIKWSTELLARPVISVHKVTKSKDPVLTSKPLPCVFLSPIRPNVVKFIHGLMQKNKRQPYAVYVGAGHQHSAESWGTGRAVSRIPRVSGGGTSRAGQGAFGNMCRSGRMFAPTKTWRKWHVRISMQQKRFATASCIAATAVPALVEARGHHLTQVPEIPLVCGNRLENIKKTKEGIAILKVLGAYKDVEKAKRSKHVRPGQGKARNRRFKLKKGPLIVYEKNNGLCQALRNLPGLELCQVKNLNVLLLAPGGTLGRFVVWTQNAFTAMNKLWGFYDQGAKFKSRGGFHLPRPMMTHPDLSRIINSHTIQSKLRKKKRKAPCRAKKKNPLKNLGVMVRLNPYVLTLKRQAIYNRIKAADRPKANKQDYAAKDKMAWRKKYNYLRMATDSNNRMTKEKYDKQKAARKARQGLGKRMMVIKKAKNKDLKEFKARMEALKVKALADPKFRPSLPQIKHMIDRRVNPRITRKKYKKKKAPMAERSAKNKAKTKRRNLRLGRRQPQVVKGAKVSAKAEEAQPFKSYDNDDCMGKEGPLEAILGAKYVQGEAPKKGNNLIVLLWRKSYKSGYKFMPLYSALSEKLKDKPIEVVGVCLDRDKNAAAGFIKKYTDGPKGNFTTSFAIAEEWAPANKVYPLNGRPVEKGFLDHMVDIHPGMKEIPSIPHVFVMNSRGTIVWHQDHSERGAMAKDNMDLVTEQVNRLLSAKVLQSVGDKIVAVSEDEEDSSDEEDGDDAVGDMGDFFTSL